MDLFLHDAFERSISFPAIITWQYRTDTYQCNTPDHEEMVALVNEAYALFRALHGHARYNDKVSVSRQVLAFEKRERAKFELALAGLFNFTRCQDEEQSYAEGRTDAAFAGWLARAKQLRFPVHKQIKVLRRNATALAFSCCARHNGDTSAPGDTP